MKPADTPSAASTRRLCSPGTERTAAEAASEKWFDWYGVSTNGAPPRIPAGAPGATGVLLFGCTGCGDAVAGVDAHGVDSAEPVFVAEMRWAETGGGRSVPQVLDPDDLPVLRTDCPRCGELSTPESAEVLQAARRALRESGEKRRSHRVARVYLAPLNVQKR